MAAWSGRSMSPCPVRKGHARRGGRNNRRVCEGRTRQLIDPRRLWRSRRSGSGYVHQVDPRTCARRCGRTRAGRDGGGGTNPARKDPTINWLWSTTCANSTPCRRVALITLPDHCRIRSHSAASTRSRGAVALPCEAEESVVTFALISVDVCDRSWSGRTPFLRPRAP
jgi:hypothetical protein